MHDPKSLLDIKYTWEGKIILVTPTWEVLASNKYMKVVANQMWSVLHREECDALEARNEELFEEACSPGLTKQRIREIDLEMESLEKKIHELYYVPVRDD